MLSVSLKRVAEQVFLSAGTNKIRNQCLRALREDDVLRLVSMDISARDYTDAGTFRRDYQCVNLLRKLEAEVPGINRSQAAVDNFWQSERQCWDTNRRFERLRDEGTLSHADVTALSILERGKRWLARTLGTLPEDLEMCRFGPGSTSELRGPATTIPDKIASPHAITQSARDLLPLVYRTRLLGPIGRQSDPNTVRGNVFTTVPKDAKKDRGICIEPGLNVWFQLGVGAVLRDRLRKIGVDLDFDWQIHRQWAKQASHDGLRATIDLSNASDCLSRELVRWLLPPDWFVLLDCLRSPLTYLGEKRIKLEKFSSMGNGYTFELETLVFLAICYAVRCGRPGKDFRVFGDDIIVDTDHAADVLAALKFCGFTPNERKTFVSGWFRESCGGDYFKGVDVTVHKQTVDPAEPHEWISLANGIRRTAVFCGIGFCYTAFFRAWLACLEPLPEKIRWLRGPEDLGDLVIHDHEYPIDYSKGYGRVRALKPCFTSFGMEHWSASVVIAYLTYSSRPPGRDLPVSAFAPKWPFTDVPRKTLGVIPRGDPKGYRIGYIAYG